MKVQGRCHCGAISYEAEVEPGTVNVCHCLDCQMLTGSAFRANIAAPAERFRILTGRPRQYIKIADSGARRVHPKSYALRLGALSEKEALGRPHRQIWTKRRLSWVPSLEGVPESHGQPSS
jgi:hypothetical protein